MREQLKRAILYLFNGPNWVTWITHGTGAGLIAYFINPPAAITAYVMRAAGHLAYAFANGQPLKWGDRIPDVGSAIVSALFVARYLS